MSDANFKIAVFLSQKENLKILTGFLEKFYSIIPVNKIEDASKADMLITDGLLLKKHCSIIKSFKESSGIVFFPVLVVTNVKDAGLSTSNIWRVADELLNIPIVKIELLSRVKILTKTRELSLYQQTKYVENLKKEKKKVEESEQKFKSIFENNAAVKLIIDPETGQIFTANNSAASYYGWTLEELTKMTIYQINTASPDEINKMMKKVKETTKLTFEIKHRNAQGKIRDVVVYCSKVYIKNKEYLHSIVYDNTDKKKAEKEVKLLSTSVKQSPTSILIANYKGNIEYVNPFFTKVTGYSFDEVIGKTPKILNSGTHDKAFFKELWETIQAGEVWQSEICNKKKNGELFWENQIISPIYEDNKITHFVGVKEDITEKRKLIQELIFAKDKAEESDRLKTAFLHNISHEIRTPLNAIIGFSNFLTDPETLPNKRKKYSEIIKKSSDHLLSIVDDILKLSSIESGTEKLSLSDTNINDKCKLLYDEFRTQAQEKNIAFEYQLELPDEEANVQLDETKFLQILTNLLSNAFKFTYEGSINFGYTLKENKLEFFVEDSGIGIPSKYHEEIFERFHKVEMDETIYGGSGIGLSISKAYAEMLGGKIWFTSEEGKGSVFYFSLPCKKKKQLIKSDEQDSSEPAIDTIKKTILVAEDEQLNFLYINAILSKQKYQLLRAKNGEEAVEIFESNPQIDLVLMDIKMPLMNGFVATEKIKELRPDIPVIAQTAYSMENDRNKAFESGCTDILSKPFSQEDLLQIIAKYLK